MTLKNLRNKAPKVEKNKVNRSSTSLIPSEFIIPKI